MNGPVGGREMHVEHLHGGELLQDGSWGETGGAAFEPGFERDLQAVGEELDEDMRLDAPFELVMARRMH